jgi:hypothetical protein
VTCQWWNKPHLQTLRDAEKLSSSDELEVALLFLGGTKVIVSSYYIGIAYRPEVLPDRGPGPQTNLVASLRQ